MLDPEEVEDKLLVSQSPTLSKEVGHLMMTMVK